MPYFRTNSPRRGVRYWYLRKWLENKGKLCGGFWFVFLYIASNYGIGKAKIDDFLLEVRGSGSTPECGKREWRLQGEKQVIGGKRSLRCATRVPARLQAAPRTRERIYVCCSMVFVAFDSCAADSQPFFLMMHVMSKRKWAPGFSHVVQTTIAFRSTAVYTVGVSQCTFSLAGGTPSSL